VHMGMVRVGSAPQRTSRSTASTVSSNGAHADGARLHRVRRDPTKPSRTPTPSPKPTHDTNTTPQICAG
jgi:hypothetical protein